MKITIYHNNRCSKSREALEIIKSKTSKFKVIEYLKNPLTVKEINLLLLQLNIQPIELVRKQEKIWKNLYKNQKMNKNELIEAIIKNPKLMQRPIVSNKKKAIIGRPPEEIIKLFN